jgi:hypothetical protein
MVLIAQNDKSISSCTAGTAVPTEVRRRHEEYIEIPRVYWSSLCLWILWFLRAIVIGTMLYGILAQSPQLSASPQLITMYWIAFLIDLLVR